MTDITYCKNKLVAPLLAVGVFLASAFLFASPTQAADEAQIQAAIKDLSSATGQNVTSQDQAKALCNQEQYLDTCAKIGKSHDLYTPEEVKRVDDFLSEVKGKILNDIKTCSNEECLVRVAGELAKKLKDKNSALAADFDLTAKIVEGKNTVVQAAKEAGVSFRDCEAMNPDTAPIELLRKCAKLAQDSRVQNYIPEEKRALAAQFGDSTTLKLREALSAGKYQCGDGTLDGCGNFCLKPTGTAGIPAVCSQIASEIFGQEGVKQLEAAHKQVGQVKDYFSKKLILVLPDGKELAGENQIKSACDRAFSSRDFEIAKVCGNFAVSNGFADQGEVDKGLKLMESFTQKGQNVDFEKCLNDPRSCRDLIPENDRKQFDAGNQIFEIMRTEIGFDPQQCEKGAVDETIGKKCFEGSKRALAKIESLGLTNQSKEAASIIQDIRSHVATGDKMAQRKDEFKQIFNQQGGPGGCRSEAECFNYCSNPTNGPECISFGAKQGVSGFTGNGALQKFQEYNQNVQKSSDVTSNEYKSYPSDSRYPQFPGQQGPYPGFQPPGQGGSTPPGQVPGFTQPGPGFSPPPGVGYYPGPGSAGPSPECFAAIQSGDFVRAKTACVSFTSTGPLPPTDSQPPVGSPGPYPSYSSYPTFTPSGDPAVDCQKAGGTWDSAARYCKFPVPSYSSGPYPTYSQPPVGSPGPYPTYSPGPYPTSSPGASPYPTFSPAPGTSYTPPPSCPSGQWWDYALKICTSTTPTYSPVPTIGTCPTGYHYHGESGEFCMNNLEDYSGTCYNSAGTTKITCPAKPTYSPYPSPSGTPTSSGTCPSGSYIVYVNSAGGYCQSNLDPSKCGPLNSTSVTNFGLCSVYQTTPTFSPAPGTSYTPPPSCPSGQWWDYALKICTSTTPTYSPVPVSSYTPYPSPGTCPSGQYWSGTACVISTTTTYTPYPTSSYPPAPTYSSTPYPTTTYSPPPSSPPPTTYSPPPATYSPSPPPPTSSLYPQYIVAHCQQLGRTWNGKICQANGLFARFFESSGMANALRLFYIIP